MDICEQSLLHFSRPMESLESTRQWRARLPQFERSRRVEPERAQAREGAKVCHTPASRWRLTDRQYSMRRPLFTSEQCASSSMKTQALTHTEKVNHIDVSRDKDNQHLADSSILSHRMDRLSFRDSAAPLLSRLELSSTPAVPDLSLHLEELTCHLPSSPQRVSSSALEVQTSQSPSASQGLSNSVLEVQTSQSPSASQGLSSSVMEVQTSQSPSASQRLSSSVLEVQRLNPPLRPPLSSTVLYPTYRPRWGLSTASGQAPSRLGTQREPSLGPSDGLSKGQSKSPHKQNYWTCAIPKGLPPSPNRRSADWDPNVEYEDLLDYTYPLRAGRAASTQSNRSSRLKHPPAGPDLQDSGIGLDRTCSSSTSLSPLCLTTTDAGNWRAPSAGQRSPDLRAFSGSPDCLDADHTAWSLDSEDAGICDRERSGRHQTPPTSPVHSSIPALTSFLPTSWRVGVEVDEEFWPLPEQLEELQLLSRQVREVAAQLRRPPPSGQRSPSPKDTFVSSSFTLPQREKTDAEGGCATAHQTEYGTTRLYSPKQTDVAEFSGRSQPSSQKNREESESLLQHIQIFCSHLEELIRQLYAEAERTKQPAVPTAAMHNAKTWLDECQTFQPDLCSHQPATSSVLSTGLLLLRCIHSMSPFLRDTLLLIEKRSGLQASSLLSPVDRLLQSTLAPHTKQEDPGLVAVHGAS